MSLTRRDFMKLFGVSIASLLMTRCRGLIPASPTPTCYAPLPPPTDTPSVMPSSARERLRFQWMRFGELAQKTLNGKNEDSALNQEMIAEHRATLDEMIAAGEISASVADLVQESFDAAIYHIWRSNAPITCYEPVIVDYAPSSAGVLVRQSEILNQVAVQGTIDPETLERAKLALEHDMAFYALTDSDIQLLYERIVKESQDNSVSIPSFEELQLEITPDAREAAQFILDLLTGK